MERYVGMESPFTGGRVKEVIVKEKRTFRSCTFEVTGRYYVCEDTGERFTDTNQDDMVLSELYSRYRLFVGIPFPDEIKETRERYGLNLTQMTKILGFGANQCAKYEEGQMPSESNGKMLKAIGKRKILLNFLELAKSEFEETEFNRIRTKIISAVPADKDTEETALFYSDTSRSVFNGFSRLDSSKLKEMVRFFVSKEKDVFPTKLNKEMFYADFLHYKNYGQSISGLQYQAIQYGPVPYHFATIYDNMDSLDREYVFSHGQECLKLSCHSVDMSVFSEEEINTLQTVAEKTLRMSTKDLIDASHKEDAWLAYQDGKEFIPYTEALTLKFVL